jgi:hypothetical protein
MSAQEKRLESRTTYLGNGLRSLVITMLGMVGLGFLFAPLSGLAVSPQIEQRIVLDGEESLKGPLVLAAKEVTLDQQVEGDVFVLAQRAIISGDIKGDLSIAAFEISITGNISGNVSTLGFNSAVTGNVTGTTIGAAVQCVYDGAIADVFTACIGADVAGEMSGDAWVYTNQLQVGVTGPGGIHVRAPVVLVRPETKLAGTLQHLGQTETILAEGAEVGTLTFTQLPFKVFGKYEGWQGYAALFLSHLIWIVTIGIGLYFLQKKWFQRASESMSQRVFMNLWIGIGVVLITTFVSMLLFISRLGWQFGAVLALALFLLAHIGMVIFANAMGRSIGHWIWKNRPDGIRHLLFGSVVVALLLVIPIVGSLISIIIVLIGLGALTKMAWQGRLKKQVLT